MPFDPDDPRLTAYALGELDPADRASVEAILRDDPDARGFVLGVEETARLLAEELRHEAIGSDGLDPARREAIERHLSSPATLAIAAPPAKARFRAWMPVAAAAGIVGVAAAITLPRYLASRNVSYASHPLARAERPAAVGKAVHSASRGSAPSREPAAVVAADATVATPASPAAVPARNEREGFGEALATEGRIDRKAAMAHDQYNAATPGDLPALAQAESKVAQQPAVPAGSGATYALGVQVPAAGGGRAVEGMGPMGGGMGGMGGGMGGKPGGEAQVQLGRNAYGSIRQGRLGQATGSPPVDPKALSSRVESATRAGRTFGLDASRSKDVAEETLEKSKDVRSRMNAYTNNRQPVVVGTQGPGVANFQANVNGQVPPGLAAPSGQPSSAAMAANFQPGQGGQKPQGQAGQNAPQARPAQPGVYYYDVNAANTANMPAPAQVANMPSPAQQPQGAANNVVQSMQNQGPGNRAQQGQGQNSVAQVVDGAPGNRGLNREVQDRSAPPTQLGRAMTAQAQGKPGQAVTDLAAGVEPAQQAKPAAAAPAPQPAQSVAFAPAPPNPAMPAPAAGEAKGDPFDAVALLKAPGAVPAEATGKPMQAPRPELKVTSNDKANLETNKGAAPLDDLAGVDAKRDADAKAPVQLALVDEAARARLAEVDREVDAKRGEIRRLAEEAETLRRQKAREQTRVDREAYARFYDHPFLSVLPGNELSTFAIDVDTGSYSNVRRFLSQGQLPPPDAVRIEELLNYFRYDDPAPKGDEPFSVNCEVAACPWDADHRLARVGLKGKTIEPDKRPMSNLVFLIDVSGSMSDLNKLPLLKAGMKLLVEQLTENDRVGIVTYSNEVKETFPSTPCHRKAEILAAIDALQAGGGTNGGAGIQMAYGMAEKNYLKGGGTNRVILATDGDFNVGMTKEELLATSEARAKSGIFLTVLGFGEGNLQEEFMEQLADKGNGHYCYIDTIDEARKVMVRELSGTLVAIAKDVKVQVEFNPDRCSSYRLIGYENRVMEAQDFRDDKKDAGEIGAGHSVTALYEIVPTGAPAKLAQADRPLKYRRSRGDAVADKEASPELFTVYLRYKQPDGDKASEISRGVVDDGRDFGRASTDLKFSASVAGFGMLLRGSPYKGSLTYPAVLEIASSSVGADPNGDRKGFLELIRQAEQAEGLVEPPVPPPAPR